MMTSYFNCKDEEGCKELRTSNSELKTKLAALQQQADRDRNFAEGAAARIAELETHLMAASGATIVGREQHTIKKLQRSDLTQRTELDQLSVQLGRQAEEIRRLETLCKKNKIDTTPVLDASPLSSLKDADVVWGGLTGGVGV